MHTVLLSLRQVHRVTRLIPFPPLQPVKASGGSPPRGRATVSVSTRNRNEAANITLSLWINTTNILIYKTLPNQMSMNI